MAPGSQKMVSWATRHRESAGQPANFYPGTTLQRHALELDGTDNRDQSWDLCSKHNLDAVTEAKVALQNYNTRTGKAVASVVTAQTKSGTKTSFMAADSGSPSDAQQARDPFTQYQKDPITGRFIPPSRWQQFGGTIGGAVVEDKYFFGNYPSYAANQQHERPRSQIRQPGWHPVVILLIPLAQPPGFAISTSILAAGVAGGSQFLDP